MQNQRRDRNRLQIFGLIRFRESFDAFIMRLGASHHRLPPPVLNDTLMNRRAVTIETVEGASRNVEKELSPVVSEGLTEAVEHLNRQSPSICVRLEHQWRHRTDQYRLADPAGRLTVPGNVPRHFPAAGRMTDVYRIAEVQRFHN